MIQIKLLACSAISPTARQELQRAECPIHENVLAGYEGPEDVLIVELPYGSQDDLHIMSVWDHSAEIQIESRDLNLYRVWREEINGYALVNLDEIDHVERALGLGSEPEEWKEVELGDLDDHPF